MPLVSSKELLTEAKERGYALGAFNATILDYVRAIVEAAEEEEAPVIVQATGAAIEYMGLENYAAMVKACAEDASVPVVLHLDHGLDFYQNIKCLRAGFTSLMFDGSSLPFEENVSVTKRIVDIAHACGVPVEGELGKVPIMGHATQEDVKLLMTEPKEAAEFVELTGVDSLAVAVGSVHGMRQQVAQLDIPRLREISELVRIPLVLHGASGVTDEGYRQAILAGVCKINIATELNKVCADMVRRVLMQDPDLMDLSKVLAPGREAVKQAVKEKMRLFGASGKAR